MQSTMHVYEVRPRKDKRGIDLILKCDAISVCVLAITRRSLSRRAQAMEGEAEKLQLLFRYLDGS